MVCNKKYTGATGFALDKARGFYSKRGAFRALYLFSLRLPATSSRANSGDGFLELLTVIRVQIHL